MSNLHIKDGLNLHKEKMGSMKWAEDGSPLYTTTTYWSIPGSIFFPWRTGPFLVSDLDLHGGGDSAGVVAGNDRGESGGKGWGCGGSAKGLEGR